MCTETLYLFLSKYTIIFQICGYIYKITVLIKLTNIG
uniref:Uncharacterized protein n=1 Tax=Arundo donax TaxID=35708 RepID=A0A0A9A806_ARUDO